MSIPLDPVERRVLAILIGAGEARGRGRDFVLAEGMAIPGTIVRRLGRKLLVAFHRRKGVVIVRPSIGAAANLDKSRHLAAA